MFKTRVFQCTAVWAMIMVLAGCTATHPNFTRRSIPLKSFLVGGGFTIQYIAPAEGIAYWVEETSQKILETQSMRLGDKAEFDGEPEQLAEALGIPKEKVRLTLYFIPDSAKDGSHD